MRVLAVEGAPSQGLVDILKPMGADEIGVVSNGAKVTGVGRATFALFSRADQAFSKQTAIGRAEMKLADQCRFAECMEPRPFVVVIVDRSLIEIKADNVAPAGAGLDHLGGPPGEPAAEIEMVRIVTMERFAHRAVIGLGKPPGEGGEIANYRRMVEACGR